MSLINQMLQDLDARRSEVTGTGALGSQIRVVARHDRSQVAWWMVAALAVVLAGVIIWVVLRPAPYAAATRVGLSPQLPVKSVAVQAPVAQEKQEKSNPVASPAVPQEAPVVKQREIEKAETLPKSMDKVETSVTPVTTVMTADEPAAAKRVGTPDRPAKLLKPFSLAAEPAGHHTADVAVADRLPPVPAPLKVVEPVMPFAMNKQVKEQTPQQRADNEYRKALLLRQQGKQSETIASLEQVLQLDPQLAAARQVLVGVLIENSRQDDALRRAREGVDIDPAQPGLAMIASRLQLEKGNLRPAIETLEHSLRYAIDRADYQAYLAALLQRDSRNKEAVEHYLIALQKSPQTGVWWMGLGISLQAENRLAEAQEAFSRAKASNSLSPELLAFVESKLTQLQR